MATNVPLKEKPKLTELSVHVEGVRVIRDARIMQTTDEFVVLRFRKAKSAMRLVDQTFPWSSVLYLHDRCPGDNRVDENVAGVKHAKRVSTAIVIDRYEIEDLALGIDSHSMVNGKIRCVVQGRDGPELIFVDPSLARLVRPVSWNGGTALREEEDADQGNDGSVGRPLTVSPAFG